MSLRSVEVMAQVCPLRSNSPANDSLADQTRQIVEEVLQKEHSERHDEIVAAFSGARAATQDLLDELEARLVAQTAETLKALEERIDRRIAEDLSRFEARAGDLGEPVVREDRLEVAVPTVELPTPGRLHSVSPRPCPKQTPTRSITPQPGPISYALPQSQPGLTMLPRPLGASGCITGSPCRAAARGASTLTEPRASSEGPPRPSINGLSERLAPPADGVGSALGSSTSALFLPHKSPSAAGAASPLSISFRTLSGSRPGSLTSQPGRATVGVMTGGSMQLAPGCVTAAQAARIALYPQLATAASRAQPAVNRRLNMDTPSQGNVSHTPQSKPECAVSDSSAKPRTQHNL